MYDTRRWEFKVSHQGGPPSISVGYFEDFGSTELAMKQVMAALDSNQVNLIRVYGTRRVGKTMLMIVVAKQLKRNKTFDEDVITTVRN